MRRPHALGGPGDPSGGVSAPGSAVARLKASTMDVVLSDRGDAAP